MLTPYPRSGCALPDTTDTTPDIFPLRSLNSYPSPAVSRHPHLQSWIVISSQCWSLPLVSVTSSPCHLIFHIPSDVSTNPASHATAKRHQSHHPIPSQIFRSPPIYPHGSCLVPNSPLSPRLASSCLISLSAFRLCPCSRPCACTCMTQTHTAYCQRQRSLLVTRFIQSTDTPDRFHLSPPDGIFRCTC